MSGLLNTPTWRGIVDTVDRIVTPPANAFVQTNLLADAIAVVTRLEVRLRRTAERQTAWVWHLYNLPTASDTRAVRAQLAAVEARVRDISDRLDDLTVGGA